MNFKPLNDYVAIKPILAEKTQGGIIIPDSAQEKPTKGEIVAIGKNVKDLALKDTVLYKEWGGNKFKLDGEEYILMKEEEIFGIFA